MIELEKKIIAAIIEYPDYAFIVIENCGDDFFTGKENQKIYRVVKGFYEQKQIIDWATVMTLCKGEITESYFSSMVKSIEGLYPSGVEKYLIGKIKLIKAINAKKKLLAEIERQAKLPEVDFQKIEEIARKGKAIEFIDEKSSFEVAYKEYLEWKKKEKTNITSGFPSIDKAIGSFSYGEVVSIFGRTTTGKTFLSLNILEHILNSSNDKVGFFSLEMAKPVIFERITQLYFLKSRWDIQDELKSGEIDLIPFIQKYKDLKLYGKIYSVSEIARITKRDGLKVAFIDFLQLLKEEKSGSQYERTTRKITEIKEYAKNQDVVVFLNVQLSRKGEGGWEPVSIDMARESGAIEELSDFIIGIWNPSLKEGASEGWKGKLCMKLLKNKRGMPISLIANFDNRTGRITEIPKGANIERN